MNFWIVIPKRSTMSLFPATMPRLIIIPLAAVNYPETNSLMNPDAPDLCVREQALESALERAPCTSRREARRFVLFACRCIESTPVNGVTPHALLTAWPGLLGCMSRVADWAAGGEPGGDELLTTLETAHRVAMKAAGDFYAEVSGPPAACWAVYHLANAALISATANETAAALGDVAGGRARRALARRAGVTLTAAALEQQERQLALVLQQSPE